MDVTHPCLAKENAVSIVSHPAHKDHFKLLLYCDQLTVHCHASPAKPERERLLLQYRVGIIFINMSLYLNMHISDILKYDRVICLHHRVVSGIQEKAVL